MGNSSSKGSDLTYYTNMKSQEEMGSKNSQKTFIHLINSDIDYLKYNAWSKMQEKKVGDMQCRKFPYYGAEYTFEITPTTSFGILVKVKNNITGDTIDISK